MAQVGDSSEPSSSGRRCPARDGAAQTEDSSGAEPADEWARDAGDWRDTPLTVIDSEVEPEDFLTRQESYFERLLDLLDHGLPLRYCIELARAWT